MSSATHLHARPAIEYPDCDGEPMSDNTLQFKWISTIVGNLEAVFRNDPQVFVAGNLLWYAVEGDPSVRAAPAAMVALGRPKGRRGSYKQWEEGNVAPQVVFEVLSPENRAGDLSTMFQFYEMHGVEECYFYDPDDGSLEGWVRAGDRLRKIPSMAGFVSPLLRIRFEPGDGPDNLMILGPDGKEFLSYPDLSERCDRESQRADAERQCADIEHQRAEAERSDKEAERQRAERLAARLRELGVDPD